MLEYDSILFNDAVVNITNASDKLENKKTNINDILSLSLSGCLHNEDIEDICSNILQLKNRITELKLDAEAALKRMNSSNTEDELEDLGTFSTDTTNNLEVSNSSVQNSDNLEVTDFSINITNEDILNSTEYTEEEKEKLKYNYDKENYTAIIYIVQLHQLNKELAEINKELEKFENVDYETEIETANFSAEKESLQTRRSELMQQIYDTEKLLELAEFEYLDYIVDTEEFTNLSNIENPAISAFNYLKQQELGFTGINGPLEDIFMNLSVYVTYLRGNDGEYGTADRLYLEQILNHLCGNEEFKDYLISVGVAEDICADEKLLFSTLIQYQQQAVSYAYTTMTDDERKRLNYLYQTDKKEADKYVEALEDTVNDRYGYMLAMNDVLSILEGESSVEEVFKSVGTGIMPGVKKFGEDTKAWLTGDTTKTYTDYQIEYVPYIISKMYSANENLSNEQLETYLIDGKINEEQYKELSNKSNVTELDILLITNQITEGEYNLLKTGIENLDTNNEIFLNVSYSIGVSTGVQLPAMATSLITGGVTGYAGLGQALANVMMFTSSSGSAYKQAVWKGFDESTARRYGFTSGLSEIATGYFLGKMPGISHMDNYMKDVKSVKKLIASIIWNSAQEGFEEYVQVDIEKYINSILLGEPLEIDNNFFNEEQMIAFISGFISSGVTQVTLQVGHQVIDISFDDIVSCLNNDGTFDTKQFKSVVENKTSSDVIVEDASDISEVEQDIEVIDPEDNNIDVQDISQTAESNNLNSSQINQKFSDLVTIFKELENEYFQNGPSEEGDLPLNFDFNKYFANKEHTLENVVDIYKQVTADGFNLTPKQLYSAFHMYHLYGERLRINENNPNSENVRNLNNWSNTIMINRIRHYFSGLVSDGKLAKLRGTCIFLDPDAFAQQAIKDNAPPNAMGYNIADLNVSYLNLKYQNNILLSNVIHESVHQLTNKIELARINSRPAKIVKTGLLEEIRYLDNNTTSMKYYGINEITTEYFAKNIMGSDYPTEIYCGYQYAVVRLEKILNLNIESLDVETLKKAYIENDIEPLKNAIDKIAGDGYFEMVLVPAFDEAAKGNLVNLDKVVSNLTTKTYQNSVNTFEQINSEYLANDTTLEDVDLPSDFDSDKYFSNKEFTPSNMAYIYNQIKLDGFNFTPEQLYSVFYSYVMKIENQKFNNLVNEFEQINSEHLTNDTTLEDVDLPSDFDSDKYFSNKEFTPSNMASIYNQIKLDGFNFTPEQLYSVFYFYSVKTEQIMKMEKISSLFSISKEYMQEVTDRIMKNKVLGTDLTFDHDSAKNHVNEIFGIEDDVVHFGKSMRKCYEYFESLIKVTHPEYEGKYPELVGLNGEILKVYLENLPPKIKEALSFYTGFGFQYLNNDFTRKYEGNIDDKTETIKLPDKIYDAKELVYSIDSFLNNHLLNEDIILYRGINIDALESVGITSLQDLEKLNSGTHIQPEFGFISTTALSDKGLTDMCDINLVMRVKAGTGLANIAPISGSPFEQEVLVQRNCLYHYLGVEKVMIDGKEKNYVYVEVEPMSEELQDLTRNKNKQQNANVENQSSSVEIEINSVIKICDVLAKFLNVKIDDQEHKLTAEEWQIYAESNGNFDFIPQKISEYFDKVFANDPETAYYTLLNISGFEFPDSKTKSWLLSEIINRSKVVKNAIYQETHSQINEMLNSMFGMNDLNLTNELVNNILGDNFIKNGITSNHNWDQFIEKIESFVKTKFNESIKLKEPILWGKIDDENHAIMNDKFTTIENTTIGDGLYFLDLVYSNWDQTLSNVPALENFWCKLSKLYANICCEAINPNTGLNYDNIKFITSNTENIDTYFGNIFQTVELPELIKSGSIKYITLTIVDQTTMKVLSEFKIDISSLVQKYQSQLMNSDNDVFLNQQIFEEFKILVQNYVQSND